MADSEFKIALTLKQESPMLHFQTNEPGFCIRGTELKPALDKFLIRLIRQDLESVRKPGSQEADPQKTNEKKPKKYSLAPYLSGNGSHPALDYKVKLIADGSPDVQDPYDIYYGNSKKNPVNNARMAIWSDPLRLEILCFNPKVRKYLTEENLSAFFLCTNFGRMKSKGFGSFTVQTYCGKPVRKPASYPAVWKKHLGAAACYTIDCGENPFAAIKETYTQMKSRSSEGDSYLFRYFREKKGIFGENDPIRQGLLDGKNINPRQYRYVRAVLGTAGSYSFPKKGKARVIISHDKKGADSIARYPSPILFKIIDGKVYMVPLNLGESIFNQPFLFRSRNGGRPFTLLTPKKHQFDLVEFLDFCCTIEKDPDKNKIKRMEG